MPRFYRRGLAPFDKPNTPQDRVLLTARVEGRGVLKYVLGERKVKSVTFQEMFKRLISAEGQGRAAKTVEIFGWLIFVEAPLILLAPHFVAALLHMPPLAEQAANYFRLVGLLVGGLGMLYIASARLNAEGFVFASLLDRPLVPPAMALLWYLEILPGAIALAFAIQDFGSFLWTLVAWRAENRR